MARNQFAGQRILDQFFTGGMPLKAPNAGGGTSGAAQKCYRETSAARAQPRPWYARTPYLGWGKAPGICSRASHFMNKFRELGFIDYNGSIGVHSSLLSVVLHDQPQVIERDHP